MVILANIIDKIEGEYLTLALLITGLVVLFIDFIEKRIFKKYYLPGETHYKSCLGIIVFFFLAYGGIAMIDNHFKEKDKQIALQEEAKVKEEAKLRERTVLVISISTEDSIRIPREDFTSRDSIYGTSLFTYLYFNDTGRILKEYRLKYTSNKYISDKSDSILTEGRTIYPNEYFYWHKAENYLKFQKPKEFTVYKENGLKYTYIYYIDYIENFDEIKELYGN